MWAVRRHVGKWTKEKMDCVVVRVGTNHIQGGGGGVWILDVGDFGKEADKLIDELDKQSGKGVGMWSGQVPRVDQGETGLRSVRQGNEELVKVMTRKGWGYISHCREFMEGDRVREEWFRDGLHSKEGEGRDALTKGIGRGCCSGWRERKSNRRETRQGGGGEREGEGCICVGRHGGYRRGDILEVYGW